jgi:stage II sporulation SpoM-like protein
VDASAYALTHGVRRTRETLASWRRQPWAVLRTWLAGSLLAASALLVAVWAISVVAPASPGPVFPRPPLVVGGSRDVEQILMRNMLVLALHAMACVAGFIAGSSLPLQAAHLSGVNRWVHERGRPVAITFVVGATAFSLSWQAYRIGASVAKVSDQLHFSRAVLLLGLLPHALPELVALFLPLAAWIVASRRGQWDQLLAATLVTVALAVPVLVLTAFWEVYVAPHLLMAMFGYRA